MLILRTPPSTRLFAKRDYENLNKSQADLLRARRDNLADEIRISRRKNNNLINKDRIKQHYDEAVTSLSYDRGGDSITENIKRDISPKELVKDTRRKADQALRDHLKHRKEVISQDPRIYEGSYVPPPKCDVTYTKFRAPNNPITPPVKNTNTKMGMGKKMAIGTGLVLVAGYGAKKLYDRSKSKKESSVY